MVKVTIYVYINIKGHDAVNPSCVNVDVPAYLYTPAGVVRGVRRLMSITNVCTKSAINMFV